VSPVSNDFDSCKCLEVGVVIELRLAAAGRFDNDIDVTLLGESGMLMKFGMLHPQSTRCETLS
jgi:hypothetical protein